MLAYSRMTHDQRSCFLFLAMFLLLSLRGACSQFKLGELGEVNKMIRMLAFRSLQQHHPRRTGIIYNISLPPSISACVTAQMVRLRTGSLRRRGFNFNEFSIPRNAQVVKLSSSEVPPKRIILVYRKFHSCYPVDRNFSSILAPVIGIKTYDTSDRGGVEMRLVMKGEPASVALPRTARKDYQLVSCAVLNSTAVTMISSSWSENGGGICSTSELGDFSLVVADEPRTRSSENAGDSSRQLQVVGGAAIVVAAAAVMGSGALVVHVKRRRRRERMEHISESGETLGNSIVRGSRARTAGVSRTRPVSLEPILFE